MLIRLRIVLSSDKQQLASTLAKLLAADPLNQAEEWEKSLEDSTTNDGRAVLIRYEHHPLALQKSHTLLTTFTATATPKHPYQAIPSSGQSSPHLPSSERTTSNSSSQPSPSPPPQHPQSQQQQQQTPSSFPPSKPQTHPQATSRTSPYPCTKPSSSAPRQTHLSPSAGTPLQPLPPPSHPRYSSS